MNVNRQTGEVTDMVQVPAQLGALASSDQQRAIAEVQAALIIARANPRDHIRALDLILQDCTRQTLAEKATYNYARGGSDIVGPSIRLAECIAQRWGNMQFGVREIEQRDGESVVQAYAWDVESNTRREMTFTVPHVRDTKSGRKTLTDARDIYEMVANQGARRLRACILGVVPGDIVERAVEQAEETLKTKTPVTAERVTKLVEAFGHYGVTKDQIEKRIQRRIDAITPALMAQMIKIGNSLRDGMSTPADWFEGAGDPTTSGTRLVKMPHATTKMSDAAPADSTVISSPLAATTVQPPQQPPITLATPTLANDNGWDPSKVYHIVEVYQPDKTQNGYLVKTQEGFTARAYAKAGSTVVQALETAQASGVGVRLTGVYDGFVAAPLKVLGVEVIEEREPGSDDK